MGVKKRLDLLESRLALCDLLCVFSRFGLLYEFLQLVELTESWCTRMNFECLLSLMAYLWNLGSH